MISRITSYPGMRRGSLFMLTILFLPCVAKAQLSRLDSVVARTIPEIIQPLATDPIALSSDTALAPVIALIPRPSGMCLKTFFIDYLSATARRKDSTTNIAIDLRGVFLVPDSALGKEYSLSKTIQVALTSSEQSSLSQRGRLGSIVHAEYFTEDTPVDHSFWSGVLEPALVVLGAAAIVALFFVLRS